MARINPGILLVIVVVLLLLYSPATSPTSKASRVKHINALVDVNRKKLQNLTASHYGDFSPNNKEAQWLNLTGWRQHEGYRWHVLDSVLDIARAQATYAAGKKWAQVHNGKSNESLPLYKNITGVVRGEWWRSRVSESVDLSKLNLSAIAPGVSYTTLQWGRNITGREGKVSFHIDDLSAVEDARFGDSNVRDVSGRITIQDETSFGDGWAAAIYGVHHVKSGALLLTTTSEKFDGIFGLPHLSISGHAFNSSKDCIQQALNYTIERDQARFGEVDNPWNSAVLNEQEDPVSPMCEIIVYAQQHTIADSIFNPHHGTVNDEQNALKLLEKELRYPQGRSVLDPPPLAMSITVFSPDCGFVLESKGPPDYAPQDAQHLQGFKVEVRVRAARNVMLFFVVVLLAQLMLLVREMKFASTPATRSRISFYTISMLSLGSGTTAFGFLFLSGIVASISVLSLIIAFFGFMDGLFFAMKFMMEIWTAQEPERHEHERRLQQNRATAETSAPTGSVNAAPSSGDDNSLPLPVTTARPVDTGASPISFPPDQDAPDPPVQPTGTNTRSSSFGAIYTRYCLALLSVVFFSIWAASSSPLTFRTAYANTLCFVYFSFWVPQIYRNIIRSGRKALTTRFVVGQSLLRLLPVAYFWAVEDNVLFVDTDRRMVLVYIAWLWIQIALLTGQEIAGPRFFVNEKWSWIPPVWDYHPVLREDEEGAMMPIGYGPMSPTVDDESGPSTLGSGAARETRKGKKEFDCAICMQTIEVPIARADESSSIVRASSGAGFFAPRAYMVTPCRHIFHTACLEGWIGYRLQCPICRETLPPL